ncbi:YraN family protein [Streptosporangium sp. NBC_01639]|uniref:YraN family protein n=1 Tax=Streptosporangium sp. NBC_01639 TaxID=2975948 RepID=UPI00386AD9C6|nr:YraN family protein [Streptosporangium sp. NBC_01639]
MAAKDELGRHGEQVAVDYLLAQGMQILDRNWRCPDGEIDVVAREGRSLVVVEVKTRSGRTHGTAFEAVTEVKLARLRRLSGKWLAAQCERFDSIRVDVIALERFAGDIAIRHERGVC